MTPLFVGNWKMYKTVAEALEFVAQLKGEIGNLRGENKRLAIAPPFTALQATGEALAGTAVELAAQNVSAYEEGPYTGEVSARMLKDVGCHFVIVGHSERRIHFGEDNEAVNRKLKVSLKYGLTPILCVGETLEEREEGRTFEVVAGQIKGGLQDVGKKDMNNTVIAYEPIWAIGTGRTATPAQAGEVHGFIRRILSELYGEVAAEVPILYGGSVNTRNVDRLMAEKEINGVLVGGASLDAFSFARIAGF